MSTWQQHATMNESDSNANVQHTCKSLEGSDRLGDIDHTFELSNDFGRFSSLD